MKRQRSSTARAAVVAVTLGLTGMALLCLAPAGAQPGEEDVILPPFSLRGEFATGSQWFSGDVASSKFNEYREVPKEPYLRMFSLTAEGNNARRFLQLRASNLRQADQRIEVRTGSYGGHQLKVEFDRLPHVFSNTGRLAFQQTGAGDFALPDQVQSQLNTISTTDTDPGTSGVQIDREAFGVVVNSLASPVALTLRRHTAMVTWLGDFSPNLGFSLSYGRETRSGSRPIGTTLSAFTIQNELPEPISQRTYDLKGRMEYGFTRGVACLELWDSRFDNPVKSLTWDNPIQLTDTAGASSRGRLALPPSNDARGISLSGALHLLSNATLSGTLSRGMWEQDDPFLPFTINTAVTQPALPATSLKGKVNTSLSDLSLNVRALPSLALRAFDRRYEKDNRTPQLEFDAYVRTDAANNAQTGALATKAGGGPWESEPLSYTQANRGIEATFSGLRNLSLKLTADQETWDRTHRDVKRTRANRLGLSADYRLASWMTLRGSFRQSERRIKGEYVPMEDAQIPSLRKFDEADCDRDEASLILQMTPGERWDGSLTYWRANNDYPNSAFGVTNDRNGSVTLDLGYALSERASVSAGYANERIDTSMNSRQRTPTSDVPENDWSSVLNDRVNTYWLEFDSALVPDKLDFSVGVNLTSGKGKIVSTGAPGGAAAGEPAPFPDTRYEWLAPRGEFRYHVSPKLDVALGYRMERYRETDFAQDTMEPYMLTSDALTSTWLGARQPDYKAQHVLTLEFRSGF